MSSTSVQNNALPRRNLLFGSTPRIELAGTVVQAVDLILKGLAVWTAHGISLHPLGGFSS